MLDENDPFDGAPLGLRRAGIGLRLAGKFCDGLILSVVLYTAGFLSNPAGEGANGLSGVFLAVAFAAYVVAMIGLEWRRGYSPGKFIIGLRVRNFDDRPLGLGQALVRNAWLFAGSIPVIGPFVGVPVVILLAASIWRDPDGRGWHDRLAGVITLQVPPPGRFDTDDQPD